MTFRNVRKSRLSWVLAGAVLLTGACSSGDEDSIVSEESNESPVVESASHALGEVLGQSEQAQVQTFVNDLKSCNPLFKVVPILNCVEKIKEGQYVAHFGYQNKTSSTVTINVGLLNRFFPSPANRGQPTKFSTGTKNEVFTVPFNGSLIVWGLDGNVALAHRTSKACNVVPPPVCKTDCNDKNPCTADICDASTKWVCTHKNLTAGTSCADANACNGTETCDGKGVCKAGTTLKCDDGNACTTDTCDQALGCKKTNVADGTSCPVTGNCGAGGKCTAGVCKAQGANCNDNNPCTTDTCSGGTKCKYTPKASGSSCSDNNACNGAETCNATGACKPGPTPDCDDKNVCTIDSCLTAGGCGHVPGNNGATCTTSTGTAGACSGGVCTPGVVCTPSTDPCMTNVLVNGVCVLQPKADDTVCSDGNACTKTDVCKSGVCTGTAPVVCSGADACTNAGTCNPSTGLCVGGTPKPQGTTCNDNSLCTSNDVCNGSGQCVGVAKTCAASDQCHAAGVCDAATGICSNPNAANGTTCNDSLRCTTSDVCTNGVCGGTAVTCAAPTACHTQGVCEEATGQCTNPVAPVDTACSDGNLCTQTDKCSATGVCVGSNPVSCTGAGACTDAGTCNPTTGTCSGGTPKPNGTGCDDGVNCTTGDVCTGGTCGGAPVVCAAPADACHVRAVCAEATGVCPASPPAPVDTACNDGNACTQTDKCSATGVCTGSNPVVCSGEGACTQAGVCDAGSGMCAGGLPKPNGTSCDDGKICTTTDVCTSGTCGGSQVTCPAPADSCHTQGVCQEPSGACSNPVAPVGTSCSDGQACTTGDTCSATGVCGGTAVVCPAPADACHVQGTCQAATGTCDAPVAPVGTSCSDGDACTTGDSCNANGVCGAGGPLCAPPQTCNAGVCGGGTNACDACIADHVAAGDCDAEAEGCSLIGTGAGDVALCEAAFTCMTTSTTPAGNRCWETKPIDCLCGSALGTACASSAADGVCKPQIRAAGKVTDPNDNTSPGTRFFSTAFPIGYASLRVSCAKDFCATECK